MSYGQYLSDVFKVLIPPLWEWLLPHLIRIRITFPRDGETVSARCISVKGTYSREMGQRLVCFYQDGPTSFYPQGVLDYHRTRKEWERDVCVGPQEGRDHKIIVAAVSDDVNSACELYYRVSSETKSGIPIEFQNLPKGITILYTIVVRLAPGSDKQLKKP